MGYGSLLHYLPEHRVLVCQAPSCRYALRPGGVSEHLYAVHKLREKERRVYIDYAAGLDLDDPDKVQVPKRGCSPIPKLHQHAGWACKACWYLLRI